MNTVPKMISTKDLSYISDMINWNYVAVKKAHHYANEVIDEDVKNMINEAAGMHTSHYQALVDILK